MEEKIDFVTTPLLDGSVAFNPDSTVTRTITFDSSLEEKPIGQKLSSIAKASVSHVLLYTVNALYTVAGAYLFLYIESEHEQANMKEKTEVLGRLYELLVNGSFDICTDELNHNSGSGTKSVEYEAFMNQSLLAISNVYQTMRYDVAEVLPGMKKVLRPNWDFKSALLYALTLVTTTGYSRLNPQTSICKGLSVFYALTGAPLMFVTAADVGKLLSDMLTRFWIRYHAKKLVKKDFSKSLDENSNAELLSERALLIKKFKEPEIPTILIVSIAIGYCVLGGCIFVVQRKGWTFVQSLHFSFEIFTSITVGNTPTDTTLFLISASLYTVFSISIITMCLDLAKSKIKSVFRRIHYFGPRFNQFRHQWDLEEQLNDPTVRELALALGNVKKTKVQADGTTDPLDLLAYFHQKEEEERELQRLMLSAYVPQDAGDIKFVDDDKTGTDKTSGSTPGGAIRYSMSMTL